MIILLFFFIIFICAIAIYSWIKVMSYGKEIAQLKSTIYHLNDYIKTNDSQKINESGEKEAEEHLIFNKATIPSQINPTQFMVKEPIPQVFFNVTKNKIEKETKPHNTMENWIGKNLLAVAASMLIFIGLIFLGILTYQNIGEIGKMALMYLVSFGITATGILLNRKLRNVFTQILSGCGYGCIFISILLTHVWFNKINDITAFSLLLIWIVVALYTAKRMNSLSLSIVAHIGMVISIFMAFQKGISDDKILIVFIYQLVSVAVIVLGNMICFKKTYRFGLFLSMIMILFGSGNLWEYVSRDELSTFVVVLFLLEFLSITFLSCLLEFSTNSIIDSTYYKPIHIFNKLIWIFSLFLMVYGVLFEFQYFPFWGVIVVCLLIVVTHAIYSAIITKKYNFSVKLEYINVIIFTMIADYLMIILSINNLYGNSELFFLPEIPMLFIVAIFLFAGYKYTNRTVYLGSAYITLVLDAIIMCIIGYERLNEYGSMMLSIVYMVMFDVVLVWEAVRFYHNGWNKHLNKFKAFGYLFTEISLTAMLGFSDIENKWIIMLIILVLVNIVLYAVKFDSIKYGKSMKIIMKINECYLLNISFWVIAFIKADAFVHVLKWGLIALCVGLVVIRIMENIGKKSHAIEQFWTGLKITLLVLATVNANSDVLDYAYVFSIICMITSLGSIVLGFAMKAKVLRLYGLGTSLLCVLKMVTIDVGGLNTVTRVVAFIGGGAICFVISAVYNKINKNEEIE